MASSLFSVTKSNGVHVLPSEATPTHNLPFSWFDKIPMSATLMEMFFMYEHGHEPAKVIKQALGKGLVHYYPLAGRIVRSEQGEIMHVACRGEGVWFVEATADCALDSITEMLVEKCTQEGFPREQLLPSHPNTVGMSLMLQVTQFSCGGFVVGLKYDHIMADGFGIAQIMNGIGEIARGFGQPMVEPVWLRELVPCHPPLTGPRPKLPNSPPLQLIMDVPQDQINKLKDQFLKQTGDCCSTFDVIIVMLWQCRVRAICHDPEVVSRLLIPANIRVLLSNFLPCHTEPGYYGNCVYPVILAVPSGIVAKASIVELVNLIKDAKKRLQTDFSKWAEGDLNAYSTAAAMTGYDSLIVTDWSRLGFSEIDYGWGEPAYFAPVPKPAELNLAPVVCVIKPPTPKEGCRLITRCVEKEHYEAFKNQMMNFTTDVKNIQN